MNLIYRGAEADVFRGHWCGLPAVFKFRKPLEYRLPKLDSTIRGQRTVREAQMIHLAKEAGVRSPYLYYSSPSEALLVMEDLGGTRLKAVLDDGRLKRFASLAKIVGESVGKLHASGIMHGDLTTSNILVGDSGEVGFIDFGLSIHTRRLEDQAVDLRLIKETLTGAHNRAAKSFMRSLLEGYSTVLGKAKTEDAVRKLREIERRGRYARVE